MNELRVFERVAIDFPTCQVLFDVPANTRVLDVQSFGRL